MKTVRNSVFETNSSSTHSITIGSGQEWDSIPVKNGKIKLHGGEFGWEWAKYNDALTKANYCAVACKLKSTNFSKRDLKEVIKEFTGATKVKFKFSTSWDRYNYSYIDHQSHDTLDEITTKEDLKDFIFNKSSYLYTGNDNDNSPANFFDPEGTVYKYKLEFSGESIKFVEMPTNKEVESFLDYCLDWREEILSVDLDDQSFTYGIDISDQIRQIRTSKEGSSKSYIEIREELYKLPQNIRTKYFSLYKL